MTKFVIGLILGVVLGVCAHHAHADELKLRQIQDIPGADMHTNAAVEPAGPAMMRGTPVQYFGVESCGVKVFWLVFDDGHMARIDDQHRPSDLEGFLQSIASLPHDLVVIPCPEQL